MVAMIASYKDRLHKKNLPQNDPQSSKSISLFLHDRLFHMAFSAQAITYFSQPFPKIALKFMGSVVLKVLVNVLDL